MIAHLSGQLFKKTMQSVIIEAGGIGYEVLVPLSTYYTLPEEEEHVSLHIYTHVREDTLQLFGFHSKLEKDLLIMLISVSGIGPKLAISILSGIGPQELLEAIALGNAGRLQAIPGVGKKTSERIALELKDRASQAFGPEVISRPPVPDGEEKRLMDDALSALTNLGYSRKPAQQALERAGTSVEGKSLERLIKEALRILA